MPHGLLVVISSYMYNNQVQSTVVKRLGLRIVHHYLAKRTPPPPGRVHLTILHAFLGDFVQMAVGLTQTLDLLGKWVGVILSDPSRLAKEKRGWGGRGEEKHLARHLVVRRNPRKI